MTQLRIIRNSVQPKERHKFQSVIFAGIALLLLGGCASTYAKRDVNYVPTEVIRPSSEIVESKLLDIRVQTFDPGEIPKSEDAARGISMEIRKAEGYFIAVNLKNAMQGSGYWGPVRVIPAGSRDGEVVITGKILESDGEILKLEVNVNDATRTQWFTNEYKGVVSIETYDQSTKLGVDPFQFLYNQIANDIALHRQKISSKRIDEIRQVAELRFASDLAPELFAGYLKNGEYTNSEVPKKGAPDTLKKLLGFLKSEDKPERENFQYVVARLPSEDDPNYQRMTRIRAREHLLIDTLDQQYDGLVRNIGEAYTQWRVSRLTEMNAVREVENLRSEQTKKAIAIAIIGVVAGVATSRAGGRNCYTCATVGGSIAGAAISHSIQMGVEASNRAEADSVIHKAALEEAGVSLAAELTPVVLEVEGETVELTGAVEAKFQQWRDIMKKLYQREVGPVQRLPEPYNANPRPLR